MTADNSTKTFGPYGNLVKRIAELEAELEESHGARGRMLLRIAKIEAERDALRAALSRIGTMAARAIGCSPNEMDDYLVAISDAAIDAARGE